MAKKKGRKSSSKKTVFTKKNMWVVFLLLGIILLDLGIYFFYYAPKQKTSGTDFFDVAMTEEIRVSGFVLELSLSDDATEKIATPDFTKAETFEVKSGESVKISSQLSSKASETLNSKYLIRDFTPTDIKIKMSRSEGMKITKDLFHYKEPPFLTDVLALLAYKGYVFAEVVPFYWEGNDRLSHVNRMLVFPDDKRNLTNQTVYIDYSHLIGEEILGGPDVKKMRVISLNNEVISFIRENYEGEENLFLEISNESFIKSREDIYKYFLS